MNDIAQYIAGSEKITDVFGYWPSFHDAEVINLHLWRGDVDPEQNRWTMPVVTILVHLWELTKEANSEGYMITRHHTLATIRFQDVAKVQIGGFNHHNSIFGLHIERKERASAPTPYFEVFLERGFGMEASFECWRIEVVDAKPQIDRVTQSL